MQGPFQSWISRGLLALLWAALPVGCSRWRPAPAPLRTVAYPGAGQARTLVVLLPGRRDRPEDFGRAEFPTLAAQSGAAVDLLAVDAHLGYFLRRTVVERLREDVIAPSRRRYERIWLVGVSIGGTGAILYAAAHPEDLDGILLLAPYLGDEATIEEVAAGGLRGWNPPAAPAPDDFQRRLWAWLRPYSAGSQGRIPLFLGFGSGDSFARANGLLAEVLPSERVFTVPGGHDWKAWRAAWEAFLRGAALREQGISPAPAGAGRRG